MSFNVLPFGTRSSGESEPAPDTSAEVIDISVRRAPAIDAPRIPDHVLGEIDAAALRAEDLRADNREVRFDMDDLTGRVVASLREIEGGVVRPLPLREVVGYDDDGPQSAA
jgi:hypothetical protein